MAEMFLIFLGLIASAVLALIKGIFAVTAFSWLACLIPLGIAFVLICLMNGIDFWD
jgi:hypothetical protein